MNVTTIQTHPYDIDKVKDNTYFLYAIRKKSINDHYLSPLYIQPNTIVGLDIDDDRLVSKFSEFYWKFPRGHCKNNYFMHADHRLVFEEKNVFVENTTCIFFQFDTRATILEFSYFSSDDSCGLDLNYKNAYDKFSYFKEEFAQNMSHKVFLTTPGLLRFYNCSIINFSITLSLIRNNLDSTSCSFEPISFLEVEKYYNTNFTLEHVICTASSDSFLKLIRWIFLIFTLISGYTFYKLMKIRSYMKYAG